MVEDALLKIQRKQWTLRAASTACPRAFALILVPLIATSLRLVWVLAQPDTRTLTLTWINDSIPAGETMLLNFPLVSLLPTDETIDRQSTDFPQLTGSHWKWLRRQPNVTAPRYSIYNKQYWRSEPASATDRQAFIDLAGIRYALIRTQSSRPAGDDITAYAQANGRLIRTFCPAINVHIAQLPDDMFFHAWLQVWQVDRPGPFVALYDLQLPPDQPPVEDYCRSDA